MSVTITEPPRNKVHLSVKGWSALHKYLNDMEDTIHALHGGVDSPALESVNKLRLMIIEKESA